MTSILHLGDCLEVMTSFPADSIDAIVTDPPYGLSFMGKGWDHGVPDSTYWAEALRVAKPGAHMLAFGGTRTFHRLAVAIEDAGWELRDTIMWVYGTGFPKSLDVSKAIDKAAGAEREAIGTGKGRTGSASQPNGGSVLSDDNYQWPGSFDVTRPATPEAIKWDGWGTALKPAWEPIIVARKPLRGTVASNVLVYGTGAINIDASRVGETKGIPASVSRTSGRSLSGSLDGTLRNETGDEDGHNPNIGRFPANLIHDGSDEVLAGFPETGPGVQPTKRGRDQVRTTYRAFGGQAEIEDRTLDGGNASRYFYCAKASSAERGKDNHHPTVKPVALMRYLVRLVSPPGAVVLDPFMGSGSTGVAAQAEGFNFVGIDTSPEYLAIARCRIPRPALFDLTDSPPVQDIDPTFDWEYYRD